MKFVTDNYITEFKNAVASAQRYVYINSYTVSPPVPSLGLRFKGAWDELFNAAGRSVDVKILVDGGAESKMLIEGIRRFFNFKMPDGVHIRLLGMGKKLHAKFYLIDDVFFCVGSHNFTKRGLSNPFELSITIRDAKLCAELKTYFMQMWGLAYVYKSAVNTDRATG